MEYEWLRNAAQEYGTPLYLFDLDVLMCSLQRMKRCLGCEIEVCYAMKANPFLAAQMAQMVRRLEVCSYGEFLICRALGIPPERLVISGILKKEENMREILRYSGEDSIYTAESKNQYEMLAEWSREHREALRVYLRLSSGNQFGMDEETIRDIVRKREEYPYLLIEGIHYFSGTQKKNVGQIKKEIRYLDNFLCGLEREYGMQVRELEYGPGFGAPYFEGMDCASWQEKGICEVADTVRRMEWKGYTVFEMGRALTAMCGYYMTAVCDVKRSEGTKYCIVDGGIHQMNYDGQIRGMYQPFIRQIPERGEWGKEEYTICGALCTANDILCQKLLAGPLEKGDILVFERTGAYSVTEGMALFLSHELPAVALYSKNMGMELVRGHQPLYKWNMS